MELGIDELLPGLFDGEVRTYGDDLSDHVIAYSQFAVHVGLPMLILRVDILNLVQALVKGKNHERGPIPLLAGRTVMAKAGKIAPFLLIETPQQPER